MARKVPSRTALAVLGLLVFEGCKGSNDPGPEQDTFLQTLDGTWRACRNDGTGDRVERMTFAGTAVTVTTLEYATSDGSCGGTATRTQIDPATFVLGGSVPATIRVSNRAVTARAADVTMGGETFYTILYVDTAATPQRLHTGDDPAPGDPAHDGSTPAKRHVILKETPLLREGAAAPTHVLSGTVTGATSAGVTISLAGAATAEQLTDDGGHYAFPGLADGAYTVVPAKSGFTFTPASLSVTIAGADAAGKDFVAAAGVARELRAVWGSSSSDVWVVGDHGTILRWNGTAWSTVASGTVADLWGVWGSSATDVWAVGASGTILRWQGTAWAPVTTSTTWPFWTVWGSGPNDVWALESAGHPWRWNGTGWSAVASPTTEHLWSVWGSAANDVWAVGTHGTILHWNGTAWAAVAGATDNLEAVWGSGPDDVWAVGWSSDFFATTRSFWHWNGSAWSSTEVPTTEFFYGLWGTGPADVWAVGTSGAIRHRGAAGWSAVASPTYQNLNDVWGSGASDVWAVGEAGTIAHWNGTAWSLVAHP